ncbi:MFS transporter [Acetobacter thailandicus]|nr:MFS transporter [Acetobacter thailandicus]
MGVLVAQVDTTAVNVALPSIAQQLHASTSQLQWVVDAYLLVLASLLMLSGSLGDRLGRKRVLVTGLVIFGGASGLCALASSVWPLIMMCGLQAVGGSTLAPVALSIISNIYPDRSERAFAIGIWGAVVGVGMGLGPIIGGSMVALYSWRGIFVLNLPIIAITVPLVLYLVPESKATPPRKIDIPGQALAITFMASITFAIIKIGSLGLSTSSVEVATVLAVISGVAFFVVESRVPVPLLELRFFRSPVFSMATLIGFLEFFSYAGFVFVANLYLQDNLKLAPLKAGFLMVPLAVVNAVCAPISGWAVGKWGARALMLAGAIALLGAAILLILMSFNSSLLQFIVASMLVGLAIGLANAPVTTLAVSGMPLSRAGVAGATASTARQLGQSLGVAVLGATLNARLHAGLPFISAASTGWYSILAFAGVMAAAGWLSGTHWAQEKANAIIQAE